MHAHGPRPGQRLILALSWSKLRGMAGKARVVSALLCVVIGGCRSEEGSEAAGHESTSAVDDTEHGASSSEDSGGSDGGGLPACEDVASRLDFDRMMEDLATLESIAAEHGGNRASGLPGFDASHAWVKGELEAAGYVVDETAVDFNFAMRVAPGTLGQTAPEAVSFTHGEDFLEFLFTIPGDLEAPLSAVDLDLGPGNQSTSACEPEDFAGFTPGHIALIQRGTCTFATKIAHAAAAGAVGAIVFNQGGVADPARTEVQTVALFPEGLGDFAPIPAVFASYELGAALAAETGVVVRMVTDTVAEVTGPMIDGFIAEAQALAGAATEDRAAADKLVADMIALKAAVGA